MLETVLVSPASLYQVAVPVLQVADKIELCPEQIVAKFAEIAVGVVGVIFVAATVTLVVTVHPLASVAVIV